MSDRHRASAPVITGSRLRQDLRALGVQPGQALMVHTRMSAIGWIPGGADTLVGALLDAVRCAAGGTLMALCSWEHHCYDLDRWPADRRAAYLADPPAFHPLVSAVDPELGRLPEQLRTWPGAQRSRHPLGSFAAAGADAAALMSDQPWDGMYGPGFPLDKLVQADGAVLILGAPLETVTLLHLAEALAIVSPLPRGPGKRRVTYRMPLRDGDPVSGPITWRQFTDLETGSDLDPTAEVLPYRLIVGADVDAFAVIVAAALDDGIGRTGMIGHATSHLMPARDLLAYATGWIEARFGSRRRSDDPIRLRPRPLLQQNTGHRRGGCVTER